MPSKFQISETYLTPIVCFHTERGKDTLLLTLSVLLGSLL